MGKTREKGLVRRARKLLGFSPDYKPSHKEIRGVWHNRVKDYHPDQGRVDGLDSFPLRPFQVFREARDYLEGGEEGHLGNDELVGVFLGEDIEELPLPDEEIIERERKSRFYGPGGTLWPDRGKENENETKRNRQSCI